MTTTRFEVLGVPAPQGSKSAVPTRSGRVVVLEGKGSQRVRHRAWRGAVAEAARDAVPVRFDQAVEIEITFRMPRPKSWPKSRIFPSGRPDVDKLARSTLDGLTDGGALSDDSIVCRLTVEKIAVTGWTGAVITIRTMAGQVGR